MEEIAVCITGESITQAEAETFANNVIDRFCNPFIAHQWLSISMNYTAKMKMRCLPLIPRYYERTGKIPLYMSAGFAAYILFMKPVEVTDGVFYGKAGEKKYKIDDNAAAVFYELWKDATAETIAQKVLSHEILWEADLTTIPGFADMVQCFLLQVNGSDFKRVITGLKNC